MGFGATTSGLLSGLLFATSVFGNPLPARVANVLDSRQIASQGPVRLTPAAPSPASTPTPTATANGVTVSTGPTVFTPGGSSCHSATNRTCWMDGYTIETDYEEKTPPGASNPKVFDLHITNVTDWKGADGVVKHAMLINGVFPGPPIIADWGDFVQINVHNDMKDNGTAIHWHGLRQLGTNPQDGANGVTECPIPPLTSRTYFFQFTQYGSSWYHSHFSNQYGNGIVGSMQINGPASDNYDTDLGPYVVTDYYYDTADNIGRRTELSKNGPPPPSDNIIFNGLGKHADGVRGDYHRTTLKPGKKHRLRLINTSVDNMITLKLQGHKFKVIATDFVPVKPIVKDSLFLGVGQRYDVIIESDANASGSFWMNATLGTGCGGSNTPFPAAIFSYEGAPVGDIPKDQGSAPTSVCKDETGFEPIVRRSAPKDKFNVDNGILDIVLTTPTIGSEKVFRWKVNGSDLNVEWDKPILEYVAQKNDSWPRAANVIEVPEPDVWTWWVIENAGGAAHPIHLHGHDFLLLGAAVGNFTKDTVDTLKFDNPIRRDVAVLPGKGWLAIAFKTDNPGAWLMHCHIAWHVSQGLSVQFLERKKDIPNAIHLEDVEPTCNAWRAYAPTAVYQKWDSGL